MSLMTYERIYSVSLGEFVDGNFTAITTIESPHHMEMRSTESKSSKLGAFNSCEINLYNIGADNRSIASQKGISVQVSAGYKYDDGLEVTTDLLTTVYEGDVVLTTHQTVGGTDVVTTLLCQEGFLWSQAPDQTTQVTATSDLTYRDAFLKLSSFVPYPMIIDFQDMYEYFGGSLSLPARDTVDSIEKLCKKVSSNETGKVPVVAYFHRGRLYVTDKFPRSNSNLAVVQHTIPRERIKGTVVVGYDSSYNSQENDNSGIVTIEFKMYLTPEIELGDDISIEQTDDTFDTAGTGTYSVTSLTTELSYDGQSWDTIIKARTRG